jgi:hypothetical protein
VREIETAHDRAPAWVLTETRVWVRSRRWKCPTCGCDHADFPGKVFKSLPYIPSEGGPSKRATSREEGTPPACDRGGGERVIGGARAVERRGFGSTIGMIALDFRIWLCIFAVLCMYLNFGSI